MAVSLRNSIYAFIAFCFSLLVSQSGIDFFVTLFCAFWIFYVFSERKAGKNQPWMRPIGLEKYFLVWFLIVVIGFLLHPMELPYAAKRIFEFHWILVFYIMIEMLSVLRPDRRFLKEYFLYLIFISSVALILYFWDAPWLSSWRYGSNDNEYVRAGGFFVNPMTFAHSFALFFCLLLGVTWHDFSHWNRRLQSLAMAVLFLSALSLLLTFTRGVWIGVFVAVFLFLLLKKPLWNFIFVLLVGASVFTMTKISPDFQRRIHNSMEEVNGFSERKLIWMGHTAIFKDYPIFGAGYGQNTKILPQYYSQLNIPPETLVSHAHNQYLHLAAGTGLLGLLAYLVIWSFFFYLAFLLIRNPGLDSWDRGMAWGIMMGQIAFCVGSLTEANFEHSKVRYAVMLIWAYLVFLGRKYNIKVFKVRLSSSVGIRE